MSEPGIRAAGISWYRREDYPRALDIMEDAHVLPPTCDEWERKAERQEREWQSRGFVVVRAIIDPEQFPAWCARRGLHVDAKARMRFANEVAFRSIVDKD